MKRDMIKHKQMIGTKKMKTLCRPLMSAVSDEAWGPEPTSIFNHVALAGR
jgi:hypothetical protein